MPKHIGIVACSAPGAALCYETICAEAPRLLGTGAHDHPEVSLHGFNFGDYVRSLAEGDMEAIGRMLARSADKLAGQGADFAICPDNTVHEAFGWAESATSIPWLHIAEVVAREAARSGARRLAILGTRRLMEGPVYPHQLDALGLEWATPGASDRQRIDRIIFEELVFARVNADSREELSRIIERLAREERCDAVVLGCTELPLIVSREVSSLPILDSTRLLARAAIERALAE